MAKPSSDVQRAATHVPSTGCSPADGTGPADASQPKVIEKRLTSICEAFYQAGALFNVIHRALAEGTETEIDLLGLAGLGKEHVERFAQQVDDLAREMRHG